MFRGCNKLDTIDVQDKENFSYENGMLMNANKTKIIYYLPTIKTTTIIISGIVEEISMYAFESCTFITEIIIPSGYLQRIGFRAFYGCTSLVRLILSSSINYIDEDAFAECPSLRCGCVIIPQNIHNMSITNGKIPDYLLGEECLNTPCAVAFDCKTCANSPLTIKYSYLFAMLLVSSNK